MSDTYTKLFSSITESTVWGESYATRIVWVTMLAMADAQGNVYGAVPGLARRANVTLQEAEAALLAFMSPDPYSRTKDSDGRRIEEIDGGWRLINHGKYSAVRNADERREYKRRWDQENRPSGHRREAVRQQSDSSPTKTDSPTPPTPTPSLEKQEQKLSAQPSASRFDDWWAAYPKKVGKKPALQKWRSRGLDAVADTLIADVLHRAANDDGWVRGYVPDPLTYLNQDRWEDDLRAAPVARSTAPPPAAPSKTLSAIQTLQAMKHGHLDSRRDSGRTDQVALLESGTHPRR
ncbi:hypothetical protein [Lysobacter olei]